MYFHTAGVEVVVTQAPNQVRLAVLEVVQAITTVLYWLALVLLVKDLLVEQAMPAVAEQTPAAGVVVLPKLVIQMQNQAAAMGYHHLLPEQMLHMLAVAVAAWKMESAALAALAAVVTALTILQALAVLMAQQILVAAVAAEGILGLVVMVLPVVQV